jgi:hypothetical protein
VKETKRKENYRSKKKNTKAIRSEMKNIKSKKMMRNFRLNIRNKSRIASFRFEAKKNLKRNWRTLDTDKTHERAAGFKRTVSSRCFHRGAVVLDTG